MIEHFAPELDAARVPAEIRLRWSIRGAQRAVLEGHGEVPASDGGCVVTIQRATTFVLTAYGRGLAAVDSRSVTVTAPETPFRPQVPIGTIALWHGDPAWIPSGWRLCDGNGTPDLVNRFVLGAGDGVAAGSSGEGDAHAHAATVLVTGRSEPHGAHDHALPAGWSVEAAAKPAGRLPWRRVTGIDPAGGEGLGRAEAHAHEIRVERALRTSEARPPEPPWYALCYIIRVAEA